VAKMADRMMMNCDGQAISGDWRNYSKDKLSSPSLKEIAQFKMRCEGILARLGFEK
jgi:hypothetical protein